MASKKHVHKYRLQHIGKKGTFRVYACVLPGCTHYLEAKLAFGKETICWRCGDKCLIPTRQPGREIKHPHCVKCTKVYPHHQKNKPVVDVGRLEDLSLEDLVGGDVLGLFTTEEEEG